MLLNLCKSGKKIAYKNVNLLKIDVIFVQIWDHVADVVKHNNIR